mmetsp:Transcript_35267/g.65344  ORF Transcript_35267/g.65344 Transcript_35267/m.65344 type:complete len:131 (-) Transcript_35267:963-1355(-)
MADTKKKKKKKETTPPPHSLVGSPGIETNHATLQLTSTATDASRAAVTPPPQRRMARCTFPDRPHPPQSAGGPPNMSRRSDLRRLCDAAALPLPRGDRNCTRRVPSLRASAADSTTDGSTATAIAPPLPR